MVSRKIIALYVFAHVNVNFIQATTSSVQQGESFEPVGSISGFVQQLSLFRFEDENDMTENVPTFKNRPFMNMIGRQDDDNSVAPTSIPFHTNVASGKKGDEEDDPIGKKRDDTRFPKNGDSGKNGDDGDDSIGKKGDDDNSMPTMAPTSTPFPTNRLSGKKGNDDDYTGKKTSPTKAPTLPPFMSLPPIPIIGKKGDDDDAPGFIITPTSSPVRARTPVPSEDSGSACMTEVSLSCTTTTTANSTSCDRISLDGESRKCVIGIALTMEICNKNEEETNINNLFLDFKGLEVDLAEFLQNTVLPPNGCTTVIYTSTVDICRAGRYVVTVILEAEVGISKLECMDSDTIAFIIEPPAEPPTGTSVPTPAPLSPRPNTPAPATPAPATPVPATPDPTLANVPDPTPWPTYIQTRSPTPKPIPPPTPNPVSYSTPWPTDPPTTKPVSPPITSHPAPVPTLAPNERSNTPCDVKVDVTCTTTANGDSCDSLVYLPGDEDDKCFADVAYEVEVCNNKSETAELTSFLVTFNGLEVDLSVFLQSKVVPPNGCIDVTYTSTVDICMAGRYVVEVILEAKDGLSELVCMDTDTIGFAIKPPATVPSPAPLSPPPLTHAPATLAPATPNPTLITVPDPTPWPTYTQTQSPTPQPVPPPTPKPVPDPTPWPTDPAPVPTPAPNEGSSSTPCDVEIDLSCTIAADGDSCDSLVYLHGGEGDECLVDVVYEVKVCNNKSETAELTRFLVNFNGTEIGFLQFLDKRVVSPKQCIPVTYPSTIDTCMEGQYFVKAIVEAKDVVSNLACKDDCATIIPFVSPTPPPTPQPVPPPTPKPVPDPTPWPTDPPTPQPVPQPHRIQHLFLHNLQTKVVVVHLVMWK
jgi:hypothetical protein